MKTYYEISDLNNLKLAKIKYLVFGIVTLVLSLTIFFLEMFERKTIYLALDVIVSISMIYNIVMGVFYILKSFLLRDKIRGNFIFNLKNKHQASDEVKYKNNFIKVLMIASIPLAFSIFLMYILMFYYYSIGVYEVISFIVSLVLFITTILSFIFLDDEKKIYE